MKLRFRFLGCGGRDFAKHGHNSALLTAENDGNNMLLIDGGAKAISRLERLRLLEREEIDRIAFFPTHSHGDHICKEGIEKLFDLCYHARIALGLVQSGYKTHDDYMLELFSTYGNINKSQVPLVSLDETRDMLNLKDITATEILHYRKDNYNYFPWREKSVALEFTKETEKGDRKVVYATDHNDPDFVKSVLRDQNVSQLFTDVSDQPYRISTSHISFDELKRIVPEKDRKRVTTMHMPPPVVERCIKAGFNTAVPLLIANEPEYADPYYWARKKEIKDRKKRITQFQREMVKQKKAFAKTGQDFGDGRVIVPIKTIGATSQQQWRMDLQNLAQQEIEQTKYIDGEDEETEIQTFDAYDDPTIEWV